ncbi:glycosyl hydrolase [Pedobacter psychrophilus]|uniref:Glycosyl hydrolase n=1 Tax=Pedobacter psychrophilus TaxID=1826909 RepID=A0A179DDC6_9SPHI|nr:glycoside hydrolase family 30 protein [Pedobacter psychrophilus]OAQ38958.1 glycosyl hydrolase [Pedobacter psychrophilus]
MKIINANKLLSFLLITLLLSIIIVSCKSQLGLNSKTASSKIMVYSTVKGESKTFNKTADLSFRPDPQPSELVPTIIINPKQTFQTFIGIGGAITDASAEVYAKLPLAKQKELIDAYYSSSKGIGYTITRTNMNSCDFSSASYVYVDENDKLLNSFSVAHDEEFKIPMIQQALATSEGKMKLYFSPWSPPAWMKDNNNVLQGGKLKPEFMQSWANYYVKFINEYEKRNLPIWGLTVQNEPLAKQRWESCVYTAEEERDFIKNFLGPILWKSGMKDKKLIAWDHNRDLVYQRASVILNDPEAAKYVWGIGFHWYETWTKSEPLFQNVKNTKDAFPDKELIFTEGCQERFNLDSIQNWSLGERYGNAMINDFNNGTAAWTDWNILLDEKGGPNHVANYCFAPIHANLKTKELIYTNAYYYIGHFSKFIKPGAKRIVASPTRSQLQTTAFLNPDGEIVVVVMNNTKGKIDFQMWMDGKITDTAISAHAMNTYVIK